MDDEWEEEEQLVVVELAGTLGNEFLTKNTTTCKVLDIDSDNPFIQVGQSNTKVFAGEYEDALGTCMLFEELPRKGKDSGPELKYMCHTVKKLMMQRVFLTEKKEGETSQGTGDSGEQDDTTILLTDDEETGAQLDNTHNTVDVENSLQD
ncbi:general transcription factor 3C polypeptide 6 isoform X2 [Periophthalmus magnuspinnatus]|uniref:general transcription factor 3C polypeptide 6 isoform X2 n=1 Tax=Periophthalmus magnuspinnatus TaxID=409849 RepID=UPI002436FA64|nr:general transcription factor 3C polypeptide 6 isoform X2 [Periophthalmus magnuspinnatus]